MIMIIITNDDDDEDDDDSTDYHQLNSLSCRKSSSGVTIKSVAKTDGI